MSRMGVAAIALGAAIIASVAALSGPGKTPPAPIELPKTVRSCAAGPRMVCDAVELSAKKGKRYRRVETGSQDCATYLSWSDGGMEASSLENVPVSPRKGLELIAGSCVAALTVDAERVEDGGVAFLPQGCACRKASGSCFYTAEDGGVAEAPKGKTLGPGYPPYEKWSGTGCAPKPCVEMLGESAWPTECPR